MWKNYVTKTFSFLKNILRSLKHYGFIIHNQNLAILPKLTLTGCQTWRKWHNTAVNIKTIWINNTHLWMCVIHSKRFCVNTNMGFVKIGLIWPDMKTLVLDSLIPIAKSLHPLWTLLIFLLILFFWISLVNSDLWEFSRWLRTKI